MNEFIRNVRRVLVPPLLLVGTMGLSASAWAQGDRDEAPAAPSATPPLPAPSSPAVPTAGLGSTVPSAAPATAVTPVMPPTISEAESRPFRLGYIAINKEIDRIKPLASLDAAGFTINSGTLIGAFDQRWVGGLSMTSHKVAWWYDGGADMTAPPASFGSSVVLGFRDGKVAKLDAITGKRLWSVTLDSFSERQFLLNGTTLYVLTAAQMLYALDFQTGKTVWMFDGGFPDGLTIRGGARPIVHDNKVLFGIATGEVLAVNADTGKLVWRYNPSYNDARFHGIVGEMVIRNNHLLITRYDGLVASIDINSNVRSVTWQEQFPGLTTSVFRGNRLYVGALNGDIYALDADGGRKVYRAVTGAPIVSIAAGETTLFVAGHRGRVTSFDAATGNVIWHDSLAGTLAAPPIMYENAIYYSTGYKSIYSYKLR